MPLDQNLQIPQHVAIIMDGSGRWAKLHNKSRRSGHNAGALAVKRVITFAAKHHLTSLSLYAFSKENWKRPETEIQHLMQLFTRVLKTHRKFLMQYNVQLRAIGDISAFDNKIVKSLTELVEQTSNNTGLILNIALNYSGRWDITQACSHIMQHQQQQLAQELLALGDQPTQQQIQQLLAQTKQLTNLEQLQPAIEQALTVTDQPPIDLIIRTSNEQRLSNFFLWQAAYSELVFLPEYWPEFNDELFIKAIKIYNSRNRRFGGLDAHEQ